MERSRRESKRAEKSALLKRGLIFGLTTGAWFAFLDYFLIATGFQATIEKATEQWQGSLTGLVIALLFAPVYFSAQIFVFRPYKISEDVPKFLRLSVSVLDVLFRGLTFAGAYVLLLFSFRLVPLYVILVFCLTVIAFLAGILIRQFIFEKRAKKTVAALYEAIKNNEQEILSELCEPEAIEGLAALETLVGKLTWYQVLNSILDEKNFTVVVQSIRNRMPKFEEVTIRPGGSCVIRVMAEGI
jgi:hypothetical protein